MSGLCSMNPEDECSADLPCVECPRFARHDMCRCDVGSDPILERMLAEKHLPREYAEQVRGTFEFAFRSLQAQRRRLLALMNARWN